MKMSKVEDYLVTAFPDGVLWADGKKYYPPMGASSIEIKRRHTADFWGR